MYFHDRRPKTLLCGLLFHLSIARAQENLPQSIFSLDVFSSQKPCAQACFTTGVLAGCFGDIVGDAIGCVNDNACGLGTRGLAPNNCYCRTDLQPVAEFFLTSCVKSACTVGDASIDISNAGSIYDYYCSSQGFPVSVAATTTQESSQATTTVASSSPHETPSPGNGSGISSSSTGSTSTNIPPSTSMNAGSTTTGASTTSTPTPGQSNSDSFWTRAGGIATIVGIIVATTLASAALYVAIRQHRSIRRTQDASRNMELNGWGGHTIARTR